MSSESVGGLLREWRLRRGLSQLDLAIRADVSARHVSFVETGRTVPSAAMVLRLADHLAVPLGDRNRLLIAAGHAPVYRERLPGDPSFARVRDALRRILTAHEPYPAVAVDRRWDVLLANDAFGLFTDGAPEALLRPPINLMRLGLHPEGLAPRIKNLAQVRAHLLPRLARQAANTGDPVLHDLHRELRGYGDDAEAVPDPADIALPLHVGDLTFVTTVTTFGVAFDITLDGIAVETYLPADETTERFLRDQRSSAASVST